MDTLLHLDEFITHAIYGLLALICLPLGLTLIRLLRGPHLADRFIALDMLTGIAVAASALAAAATGRREYLDVGLGLAVFGFFGTCAMARYLEQKRPQK